MNLMTRLPFLFVTAALAGCSAGGFVSVEDKFGKGTHSSGGQRSNTSERETQSIPDDGVHIVQKGDTLYGIAWQYGVDPKALADTNRISSPFTIFPGQQIAIRNLRSNPPDNSPTPVKPVRPIANQPVTSKPVTPVSEGSGDIVAKPVEPVVVAVPPPVSTPTPAPAVTPATPKSPVVASPVPSEKPSHPVPSPGQWQWPVVGKVLAPFSSSEPVNKGIDIAGKEGKPIAAAASGAVVYAGQGLRGYGNLVIIKHDDVYLSAYAHARKILVKEGESIKAGQKIAEIGSTGTDSVKLHFEIRKNGKPVDPVYYLPKS